METQENDINIFKYLCYRQYLKDSFAHHKKKTKYFSYRYLAKKSGFSSHAFIKMVLDGARNLPQDKIDNVASAFNIEGFEKKYFANLVHFTQAETEEEKALYTDRLAMIRPIGNINRLSELQYQYFSKPYYVTIAEMVSLPDFEESAEWIGNRLTHPLKPDRIYEAINNLQKLKILVRDEDGKLKRSSDNFITEYEVGALEAFRYHSYMLDKAKQSLTQTVSNLRDINAITVPVKLKKIDQIKEKINAFLVDLMQFVDEPDGDLDDVFQVNVQLFPLTTKSDTKTETEIEITEATDE